jgi:hypothetical protein
MSLRKTSKPGYVPGKTKFTKTCRRCGEEYPKDKDHFYPIMCDPRLGYTKENPGWSYICIPCENKRSNKYKELNPEKVWKRATKYAETPHGFMTNMWNDMRRSRDVDFKNFDEFWEHWKEQEKTYGMKCPYLGIEMTMVRGKSRAAGRFTQTPTNVSRDKILPGRSYSKQNLIFVSWKANNAKHSISPKIARRFLSFVKERYGTEDIE